MNASSAFFMEGEHERDVRPAYRGIALWRLRPFGLQLVNQVDLTFIRVTVVEGVLQCCQGPGRVTGTIQCIGPLPLDNN